ncbi:MAG: hypothetical protein HZC54_25255 [Verrucomicrobia bacterium]|nr:hypothetical protein [Verrucomicrobiota bacterium]
MEIAALIIAVVSLALAGVAYWRAGGQRDVESARRAIEGELEVLRAKQSEVTEALAEAIAVAYEESRGTLRRTARRLRELKDEAVEGLERQTERALQELAMLEQRLEAGASAARNTALAAARNAEQVVALRVHRLEARVTMLFVKAKVVRAVALAHKKEFGAAERRLEEAADLLRTVRQTLGSDHVHDAGLDAVKNALANATAAVRAEAEDTRRQIERVLAEADSLVGSLESGEPQAAERKAA